METQPRHRHAVPGDSYDSAANVFCAAAATSEDDLDRISSGARASSSGRTVGGQLTLSRRGPHLARDGRPGDRLDPPWTITTAEDESQLTDLGQRERHTVDVHQLSAAGSTVRRGLGPGAESPDAQQRAADATDDDAVMSGPGPPSDAERPATELIFRLERRGEGWGEEIFPHLVLEQRPLEPPRRRLRKRSSRPDPWEVRRGPHDLVILMPPPAGRP